MERSEIKKLEFKRRSLTNKYSTIVKKQLELDEKARILENELKEICDKIINYNKKKKVLWR